MTNKNAKISQKVLAVFMSLLMVISVIPFSTVAWAATDEHPDAVTVTVKDEDGNLIKDATVDFTVKSSTDSSKDIAKTETTDEYGVVEILAADKFVADDLMLNATVKADSYFDGEIKDQVVESVDANYDVILESTELKGVTIEGRNDLTYTGEAQDLVSVTPNNYTVTYRVNGGTESSEAKGTDATIYTVEVNVTDGVKSTSKTVETRIAPAKTGIDLVAKTGLKYDDGKDMELVELTGEFLDTDDVTWSVNGFETGSRVIPKAAAVTTADNPYKVKLTVDRGSNYEKFEKTVEVEIGLGEINLGDLKIESKDDLVYNGDEQELLTVTGKGNYTLEYSFDEKESKTWTTWDNENYPKKTDAGTYKVYVKATKDKYADMNTPAFPIAVTINQAPQTIAFNNEDLPSEVIIDSNNSDNNVYDFSASGENLSGKDIVYELVGTTSDDVATISDDGKLTVEKAGIVSIKASRAGNDNYSGVEIGSTVIVKVSSDNLIYFNENNLTYTLDTSGNASSQEAHKKFSDDNGKLTYSLGESDIGLDIDEKSGKLTVLDFKILTNKMAKTGSISTTIIVDKTAGTKTTNVWYDLLNLFDTARTEEVYPSSQAIYTLTIKFLDTPENAYTLPKVDGENGWYKSKVIVTPATGYTIAKTEVNKDANNFDASVTFGDDKDQGTATRYVYLKNADGQITNAIPVNINIDTLKPETNNMSIEIQNLNVIERLGYKFGFFNPEVDIKFTVVDETDTVESGMQKFTCYYTKDSNAVKSIASNKTYEIIPELNDDSEYTATLTIKASELETYRGNIAFTATDNAGNTSDKVTDEEHIIVVDTISPEMTADFKLVNADGNYNPVTTDGITQHYYDGDVEFAFTVEEQNFFSEDVQINVTKNGVEWTEYKVDWENILDEEGNKTDTNIGTFILTGDGDYIVTMSYQDQSKNVMSDENKNKIELYTSKVITIDTKKPTVEIQPDILDVNGKGKEIQKTIFTVTEHNFRASDITVSGTMRDINENDIAFTADALTNILRNAEWTQLKENDGKLTDSYIFEYDGYIDGIYNLTMDYKDISKNDAETYIADEFIIDHTAPNNVSIEIVTSPLNTILGAITFGFYNPDVEVKFTAYDNASGVKDFTWNYTKENGASNINRPTDEVPTTVDAVQDENDKSKFTATVTLPDTDAKELRGYLAVYATDNFENASKKITDDGNIIVVDHISPEISVEYSEASRTVGSKAYYNSDIDVTFNVTEANFYAEDVKVTVTKNGGIPYSVDDQISWSSRDENNLTIGKMTLPAPAKHSGDGHYIIHVEYIDKSNNEAVSYTSHELTIDTIKPVIDVTYNNTNVKNTLTDTEKHKRNYFDGTQTTVITIKEHNFASNEVNFNIIAKDVTGNELDASALNSKTDWTVDSTGDVHTITITYPGDANYTFDVVYTDLATNEADDYAPDYFTVDKTAPTNLAVHYSTSVLDTVLESLTFGFYNAKMTVTLTAEDSTSEIHSFLYSYLNANGVSSVNAELVKQTISAADIKYSDDRKTATATFEIPKMVLANDNQFNGTVEFTATDRAGNESRTHKETKRIVVDNIAPTATVQYNDATNVVGDISYYDGNIDATITITEANFYANDVQVMVSKDGGTPSAVSVNWKNNSVDVHTGTFTLTEDGDYVVTISYRDKSSNAMATYTSKQMTIDTKIEAPTYSINGDAKSENGGAYKGDAIIAFNFEDQNFENKEITLTRTRFNKVDDVKEEFIKVSDKDKGGSGSFTIPAEVENDGIYVLKISMTDKAKHSVESQMKFTINRYGSVYEYSNYLASLIKDGGQYIKIEGNNSTAITQDLVITEYNANQILEDSLKILITRDGESIDAQYTSNPAVDSSANIGESGWYQYDYTIAKENFAEDGVYKITLASAYDTDDSENNDSASVPDNSIDETENQILDAINFTVDTHKPEIRNIVNLDKAIVNAQELTVKYTIVDVGGLKSIDVIVNGQKETITDFQNGGNAFNYTGEFPLNESSNKQTVQIIATDLAGNVTDTASDEFKENHSADSENGLYVFYDTITVSTNFFVRWYANKLLFWGSIGGVVVLAGLIWFLIAFKRKKKEDEEKK